MVRTAAFLLSFCVANVALAAENQPVPTGDLGIHDPSVIVVDGTWVAFGTGNSGTALGAVRLKISSDGIAWKEAGALGRGIPAWVKQTTTIKPTELWAPSVSEHGGVIYLYYSASTFGVNRSAIGLVTNDHFDPQSPGEGWVDRGLVLQSGATDNFNAIDPARIDAPDGRAFLAFGSFWSGIKMRELDAVSGMLNPNNSTLYSLASRGGGAIEAASILRHDDGYFLFVSFDRCCAGLASTYRIMVGRSEAVTGPYVAKDGTPMMAGGGSEIRRTTGRFIGPGGQEVFAGPGGAWLAYHYYDRDGAGVPKLQVAPIGWDADGWPRLDPLPFAD